MARASAAAAAALARASGVTLAERRHLTLAPVSGPPIARELPSAAAMKVASTAAAAARSKRLRRAAAEAAEAAEAVGAAAAAAAGWARAAAARAAEAGPAWAGVERLSFSRASARLSAGAYPKQGR